MHCHYCGGCIDISVALVQVYDLTLAAALATQRCGPKRLTVTGEWLWLLDEFAATYGIRDTYTSLAHLLWVVRWDIFPSLCIFCLKSLSACFRVNLLHASHGRAVSSAM